MIVDSIFIDDFGGIVVADHRPALPILELVKSPSSAHSLPCQQAYEVSQEQFHVLAGEAPRRFVAAPVFSVIQQGIHRQIDASVIADQRPDGFEVSRASQQLELAQAIAPQAIEVRGEGGEAVRLDGIAALQIDRATGELLDDRVVITQLYAPNGLVRVVVIRVAFVEAVTTPPDTFPVVELVSGTGLFGFVVDRQLDATGRAEHVGFATAVDATFGLPGNFLDAGDI